MSADNFYGNSVLVEDFDYAVPAEGPLVQSGSPDDRGSAKTTLLRTITAIAVSTIVVFGPCSASSPNVTPAENLEKEDTVIVRVLAPPVTPLPSVQHVVAPEAHQRAAAQFNRLFRPVPLNAAERLPDPDYGL